jgi:hypothetical protein
MKKRSSARATPEIPATEELVLELRELVPLVPSGGGFRTVKIRLNSNNRIEIYSDSVETVAYKYGGVLSRKLIDVEAGVLASYINLYMISKGFHIRYYNSKKLETETERFVVELAVHEKDW